MRGRAASMSVLVAAGLVAVGLPAPAARSVAVAGPATAVAADTLTAVAADTLTGVAVADAYIDEAAPTQAHGTTHPQDCRVNDDLGERRQCRLRFTVSGLKPGDTVTAARVLVRVKGGAGTGKPVNLSPVQRIAWSEATITWNNRPPLGSGTLDTQATHTFGQDTTWTLPAGTVTGNGDYEFSLNSPPGSYASGLNFYPKENTAGQPGPRLVVTYQPGCAAGPDAKLVPACGAWLGSTDDSAAEISLATQEALLGRRFDLVRLYKPNPALRFPTAHEQTWASQGRILTYSWKPDNYPGGSCQTVAGGARDADIDALADHIRATGIRLFLAVHHEPEGDCPAASFVAMFRHVRDRMVARMGAQAGLIVWYVNYLGHSTPGDVADLNAYYPGDGYVDWIAWDPYNWKYCQAGTWKQFGEQVDNVYEWAQANHPTKPLMIAETGTNEGQLAGESKPRWIHAMLDDLRTDHPAIKAVMWFHKQPPQFCQRRWDSTTASSDAFRAIAADPYLNPAH